MSMFLATIIGGTIFSFAGVRSPGRALRKKSNMKRMDIITMPVIRMSAFFHNIFILYIHVPAYGRM